MAPPLEHFQARWKHPIANDFAAPSVTRERS
jgi:hypothetical protein